ncbi:MAG: hypothetical protein K0S33_3148 [Bacteroidetes bacterium]|jgi:uncharacterized protein YebE (UPF0316 family)|nr:hypothetical protein [Bacteroidota bacterium]
MDNFDYFNWIILPLMICLSRLGDVTLATLRHIFVSKGYKKIVPFLGFFEVLIWLIAMRQVFSNMNNIACFIAWAGGFALGTYCGMLIEEKLALGMQIIRIITDKDPGPMIDKFRALKQGVTIVNGEGAQGPVKLIFTVVNRVHKKEIIRIIHDYNPNAFYSIEDVKSSSHGVFSDREQLSYIRRLFPEKSK